MKQYGLIGEKLGHSYSQTLHGLLADYAYRLFPLPPDELDGFLRTGAWDGLNVTIPYKRAVLPYCAALSAAARRVGSVNTLLRQADGSLYGDNTDVYGFSMMAQRAGMNLARGKTLVLGSGGASLAVLDAINSAGGQAVTISRTGENNYHNLERHEDAAYLVNATPVGMYPETDASPLDLRRLPKLRGVLDLIYNPLRTRLLQQAEALSIPCAGGLGMLVQQAARACQLFTGQEVPPQRGWAAETALRKQAMNLVLVGMPGCGKTTVGRALHRLTGLPLIDVDAEIQRLSGQTIPELFATEGEAGFRAREAEQIARYGKESGRILVTGGGAPLNPLNREHLRMNGYVAHLTRSLDKLPLTGRPLSQSPERLRELWRERAPLYAACADLTVTNEKTPAQCARAILEGFNEAVHCERA